MPDATSIHRRWVSTSVLVDNKFPTILNKVTGLWNETRKVQQIFSKLKWRTYKDNLTMSTIKLYFGSVGGVAKVCPVTACIAPAMETFTQMSTGASQSFAATLTQLKWSSILLRPIIKLSGSSRHIIKMLKTSNSLSDKGSAWIRLAFGR